MTKDIDKNKDEPVEFEDAVSATGFGWYNINLLVVCGISLMSVIMETMSMSYVVPAAKCELELTLSDKGMLSSVGFLGVVLSSLLWGFIGDTLGRRNIVLITSYISFLAGIASSLAPYVWLLILLRFLNCFFIGGPSAVIIAYLGEFHGLRYRASIITFSATFVAVASLILPGTAWIILPQTWSIPIPFLGISFGPWRLLIILYGLPTFIAATWLLFLPESPKYLWAVGKTSEALEVLKRIHSFNTGKDRDSFPVSKLVTSNEYTKSEKNDHVNLKDTNIILGFLQLLKVQILPIFCPPLLTRTFLTSFLQFAAFAGSSGALMWLPEILNRVTAYDQQFNSAATVCQAMEFKNSNETHTDVTEECVDTINTDVFIISMVIGAAFACTYMSIGASIYYTGKKRLLVGLLCFCGLAGVTVNFMDTYILISVLSGLFTVGGASVTILNTAVVDLFPTQYRSIAMAVSLMAGRTGAMVASQAIGYILEYTCITTFYLLGGIYLLAAAVALLLPES